jgi:hypothetical protein
MSGSSTERPDIASTMGAVVQSEATAAARAVKVIVTTIRPAIFSQPRPDPVAPQRIVTASLPEFSLAAWHETNAKGESETVRSDEGNAPVTAAKEIGESHASEPNARDAAETGTPRGESREPTESAPAAPAAVILPATTHSATASRVDRTRNVPDGPVPDAPSDERLVSAVLQQYRAAYERLDVTAAQTIWPTVDARALGAAFRQLAGQRVTFESCGVSVSGSGAQATARCHGQAEYMPKVGGRRAYVASGEWVFDLAKQDTAWRIVNAEATIK